jgi:nitrogen PTS system EIIA component
MKGALLLEPSDVIVSLAFSDREGVLAEFADCVAKRYPEALEDNLLQLLLERESLGSTGIGDGIAIPHCKSPALKAPVLLFGRSESGVDFHAIDGKPVRLFFLLIAPEGAVGIHLKLLARISRLLKKPMVREQLTEAASAEEIAAIVREQDIRL